MYDDGNSSAAARPTATATAAASRGGAAVVATSGGASLSLISGDEIDTSAYRLSPLPTEDDGAAALAPLPVRGLRNLGNSCYLNCVLQSVVATRGMREHFLLAPPRPLPTATRNGVGACGGVAAAEGELTAALRRLLTELHTRGAAAEPIFPTEMLRAVSRRHARYGRRAEQDSHEVLRHLLEGIRSEEVLRLKEADDISEAEVGRPEPITLIDEIYAGELRSSVVCLSCGQISTSTEPFLDLSLPIPRMRRDREAAATAEPAVVEPAGAADASDAADAADAADADADADAGGGPAVSREAAAAREAAVAREEAGAAARSGVKTRVLAQLPEALREPPVQLGLAACLQALLAPETLEGENAYSCDACAAQAQAKAKAKAQAKAEAAAEASAETAAKAATAASASAAGATAAGAAAAGAAAADAQEEPMDASTVALLSLATSASSKTGQPALKWLQVARTPRALTLHLKRFRWMGRKVGTLLTYSLLVTHCP